MLTSLHPSTPRRNPLPDQNTPEALHAMEALCAAYDLAVRAVEHARELAEQAKDAGAVATGGTAVREAACKIQQARDRAYGWWAGRQILAQKDQHMSIAASPSVPSYDPDPDAFPEKAGSCEIEADVIQSAVFALRIYRLTGIRPSAGHREDLLTLRDCLGDCSRLDPQLLVDLEAADRTAAPCSLPRTPAR